MKRHIPGLQGQQDGLLEGTFLVGVNGASYRWHSQKPFFSLRFSVLEPTEFRDRSISGRLYCTPKALWRLNWFLRDFGYDRELLGREEVDEKALIGLQGVVKTVRKVISRCAFLNLESFAPAADWEVIANQNRVNLAEGNPDDLQLHAD